MEIKRSPVVIAGKKQAYAKGTTVTGSRGIVFLSGCVGINNDTGDVPEDMGEQTTLALHSIKTRLAEQGSSLENIMHIWWYMKGPYPEGISSDPEWRKCAAAVEAFWKENCPELHHKNNPPAGTLLGVTALAGPKLKLEIMVVAAVP